MTSTLRLAVSPGLPIEIDGTAYLLEYPIKAIILAEEKLGRPLKAPADWFCAAAKDIPVLLHAGLQRNHPEVTAEDVEKWCEQITPEMYATFSEALGTLNFPKFTARYKENLEKLRGKEESADGH